MPSPTKTHAWQALEAHYQRLRETHLTELFASDPDRAERFSLAACGMLLDYSKQRIDAEAMRLLVALAHEQQVPQRIAAMFAGEKINATENRAVLHIALRADDAAQIAVDGEDVMPKVRAVRQRMDEFAHRVREGEWKGWTGEPIRDVVNIGIGGSDLGPRMACEALLPYGHPRLAMHFVSNVDGAALART